MRNIMKQKFQSKRFPIGVFVFAIAVLLSGFGVGKVFAEEGTVDRSFDFDRSQMEGKAFVFYGDSITAGLGVPDEDKRYIDLLQDAYGFYAYNGAVSGASLTKGDMTINDIYSQLEASEYLYRDADYISIFRPFISIKIKNFITSFIFTIRSFFVNIKNFCNLYIFSTTSI